MPVLARLMLVFWIGFLVYIVMRLQGGDDASMYRLISWNEFYYELLGKGEVKDHVIIF